VLASGVARISQEGGVVRVWRQSPRNRRLLGVRWLGFWGQSPQPPEAKKSGGGGAIFAIF